MAAIPDPVSFTVHSMPAPSIEADVDARRTRSGRLKMLLVFLVCASPVIASYLTYFVIRPGGMGTNYSTLILPQRPLPADLALTTMDGRPYAASKLQGQWLLVVVAGGSCDARCERSLVLQRQLYETLGREKERVDKVWFITDAQPVRPEVMKGIKVDGGHEPLVLRAPPVALGAWLQPEAGHDLSDHLYIVDPQGNWMMRPPVDPDPKKLRADIDKLLRASAAWDEPGR